MFKRSLILEIILFHKYTKLNLFATNLVIIYQLRKKITIMILVYKLDFSCLVCKWKRKKYIYIVWLSDLKFFKFNTWFFILKIHNWFYVRVYYIYTRGMCACIYIYSRFSLVNGIFYMLKDKCSILVPTPATVHHNLGSVG